MTFPETTAFNHLLRPASFFGAWAGRNGVRFALPCRTATRVILMLFKRADDATPWREYVLDSSTHRHGDTWSIVLSKARPGQYYAYRIEGPGHDPQQWVLDPYARSIAGHAKWGDTSTLRRGFVPKNGATFPKAVIVRDHFNWANDRAPRIAPRDLIIYELHVRGFTAGSNSGTSYPGTYRGIIEKIPYIKDLGFNAVELLPVFEFNELEYFQANDSRASLRNFWGYSTMGFFAPMSRFAHAPMPEAQIHEFKSMVKAFHAAGIEVILDVVYNHTHEGDPNGPTSTFRAMDPDVWYMMDPLGNYLNFSGCGNTLNANHPVVSDFIVESLRHWVTEYHIDGFRFDLATVLTRGQDGAFLPRPPLIERITEDPILRECKLIAEAWDAAGGYQVGSFPSTVWSEWNGRFRDDVRAFWLGGAGMLSKFATRLTGSGDPYDRDGQTPCKSINFVTCHDGFTLMDLVSYNQKNNLANTEQNRDGENNNHSYNHGVEGPTSDPAIQALRIQQMKNLLASVFLSLGIPMIPAGDEFGRTQLGNNNAYCQDNDISYLDWTLLRKNAELAEFVRQLIRLRNEQPAFRWPAFLRNADPRDPDAPLRWVGPNNHAPDWGAGRSIGCYLNGRHFDRLKQAAQDIFLVFNASEKAVEFHLPHAASRKWQYRLATWNTSPLSSLPSKIFSAPPHSTTVFMAQHFAPDSLTLSPRPSAEFHSDS